MSPLETLPDCNASTNAMGRQDELVLPVWSMDTWNISRGRSSLFAANSMILRFAWCGIIAFTSSRDIPALDTASSTACSMAFAANLNTFCPCMYMTCSGPPCMARSSMSNSASMRLDAGSHGSPSDAIYE